MRVGSKRHEQVCFLFKVRHELSAMTETKREKERMEGKRGKKWRCSKGIITKALEGKGGMNRREGKNCVLRKGNKRLKRDKKGQNERKR